MRPGIVWAIFRKEITDMLRDRLTLLVVIALPVLVYPLLILGITKVTESQTATIEAQASKVAVWGEAPSALTAWLERTNTLSLESWRGAPQNVRDGLASGVLDPPTNAAAGTESRPSGRRRAAEPPADQDHPVLNAARGLVASREVDAVLVVWPGFEQALENDALGKVSILYDSVRPGSSTARDRLNSELAAFRSDQVARREREHNLAEGFARVLDILSSNVAPAQRRQGEFVGSILPLLLIMLSVMGGLHPSIDLTAGEKDRNTMQTLLCAPLRSVEIVAGKFLAIWSICLLAALANTASLAATLARVMSASGLLSVPPSLYLLTFLALLPVTFTVTAFFLAVAALARDAKDAGNFLGPSLVVLTGPLAIVATPAAELTAATAFIPIVNIALVIKAAFIAEAKPELVFLALFASMLYAMLALLFAARVFGREQVLMGGKDAVRALFTTERRDDTTASPTLALTGFAVACVTAFYGTLLLQNRGIIPMVIGVQLGCFLAPALVLAAVTKVSWRNTFSLRLPDWRGVVAAVIIGLSAWAVVGGITVRLLPPPESLVRAIEKVLLVDDKPLSLPILWLVIGLTPAICEETLFRGLILAGLRKWGKWPAILCSAFLFGLAHASIYRLLPTLLLGIVLGIVVWRTGSLLCGVIIHALNNGLMATMLHSPQLATMLGLDKSSVLPWSTTLLGLAVFVVGLLVLRSVPLRDGR
jgi:sodium transport system permease protein